MAIFPWRDMVHAMQNIATPHTHVTVGKLKQK